MNNDFDVTAINLEELESLKNKLKQRFSILIQHYIEDAEKYMSGIEEGLSSGDLNVIATNAHPLKSSSAVLGLSGVSEIAKTIEVAAKGGEAINTIEPLVTPLKQALSYAIPKLREAMEDAA